LTILSVLYIRFFLKVAAEQLKMILKLVKGRINVALRVIGTAQSSIEDIMGILFCVPTSQMRFYLLTLINSEP
jgi:hypothetical protein